MTAAGGDAPAAEPPKPTRMLRREQQIGYVLAGLAAAGTVTAGAAGHDVLLCSVTGAATVALVVALRHGQRVITAIVSFAAGLAFSTFFTPLEILLSFFGLYLFMRSNSAQAKARRAQPPRSAAERRADTQARAAARAQRRKRARLPAATQKTPAPNRRYTPPKAKPTKRA